MPHEILTPFLNIDYIPFLKLEDLKDPEVLTKIHNVIYRLDDAKDQFSAIKLVDKLNQLLGTSEEKTPVDVRLFQRYQEEIILLKFIALVKLDDKEIVELFQNHLVSALRADLDVIGLIRFFVVYYASDQLGDHFIELVLKAINYNQEKIGDIQITLPSQKMPVPSIVTNWLRHYNNSFAQNKSRGILQESDYISTNKEVLKLTIEERKILHQLVKIYDLLLFPNDLVEDILSIYVLDQSKKGSEVFEENILPAEIKEISTIEPGQKKTDGTLGQLEKDVLAAYQGDPKQQQAITKSEEKLAKQAQNDKLKIRSEFFAAVQRKDLNLAVGALRLLAKNNDLESFLNDDAKLKKFLATVWEKQYGKDYAKEFLKNPAELKFVRQFLKYVLQERLQMKETDAARVGLQVGNIFINLGKKGYNKIAYFDVKNKGFKWFE
jgi:hypothetical protein